MRREYAFFQYTEKARAKLVQRQPQLVGKRPQPKRLRKDMTTEQLAQESERILSAYGITSARPPA